MDAVAGRTWIVFGDHRRAIWLDPRGRAVGHVVRRELIQQIASRKPGLILHTGDLVPSAFDRAWRRLDQDFEPLVQYVRNAGGRAAMDAVPGNHETYGILPRSADGDKRMQQFLKRFPRANSDRFGARDFGDMRILLLDSNVRVLVPAQIAKQESWLSGEVARADADPAVRLVVALWHHPPFTNTETYGDDRFTAASFLPRLRKSKKLGAVFCGHVHAYERFRVDGASFIVTGGGGAPAHKFPDDHARWRHTPAFDARSLSHYHYIAIDGAGTTHRATVHHFDPHAAGAARWTQGDSFTIEPRG